MTVTTLLEVIARATFALDVSLRDPVTYRLGKGGFSPSKTYPWNAARELDCSGFASWAIGLPRQYPPMPGEGQWIETSAIYADALGDEIIFRHCDIAEPGQLIVWPDRKLNGGTRQGHVGIVSQVAADLLGVPRATHVIHCSSGNFRVTGNAIRETGAAIFDKAGAILVAPQRFV